MSMNGAKHDPLRQLRPAEPLRQAPMPRVAICVPSGDMVHKGFAMSLWALGVYCGPVNGYAAIPCAAVGTEGSLIVRNRNEAIKQAQTLGVDYALFLDSDIEFPPYTLRRLLSHGKDIAGATYIQREPPHRLLGKWADDTVLSSDRLHSVEALPAGCLLIKLSVFDKMVRPYFRTPAFEAAGGDPEWIQGEDYYFCEQARKLGHEIWLDVELSMHLGHIGRQVNTIPVESQAETKPAMEQAHGQAAIH